MANALWCTAARMGLGVCSKSLADATDDWKEAKKEEGLKREYLYDFTFYRTWQPYELPEVIVEHENAWSEGGFLLDFWKLMFGSAPLRVMFGYGRELKRARKYLESAWAEKRKNNWYFPPKTEDLVLLGFRDMEPRAFEVYRRRCGETDWSNIGSLERAAR